MWRKGSCKGVGRAVSGSTRVDMHTSTQEVCMRVNENGRRTRWLTVALVGAVVATAWAVVNGTDTGAAARAAAPTSLDPPTITGTAKVGSTFTSTTGRWSGAPTSYAYSWRRCDKDGGSCSA